MKIWISGAAGHMGQAVYAQAQADGIEIVGGVDTVCKETPFPMYSSFDEAPNDGDVIVDFSRPAALESLLKYAVANHMPCVLATTGFSDEQLEMINEASKQIAIFRSGNMSIGIALLRQLSRKAAEVLGASFDIEIVEAHHNRKADAPSGTALMLYDAVKDVGTEKQAVYGRGGRECKRQPNEIGIHALRGGTVIGEHQVNFFGPMERIALSHSAESRSVFAVGALRAAAFLIGKEPGMYNMDDMLA